MATLAELLASTKTKQSDGMRLSAMLDIAKRAKADAQGKSVQDMIAEVPASVYNNPIANAAIGFTPVIGDIQSGVEALRSAAAGRWGEAALNGVGVLPFVPSLAGMFIGKGAKTWDVLAAAKAAEMEKSGADARSIWKETGTWKGPDGHWRQEVDDSRAVFERPFRKPTDQEVKDAIVAQDLIREVKSMKKAEQDAGTWNLKKFYDARPGLYEQYQKANETLRTYERNFVDLKSKSGVLADFYNNPEAYKAYPRESLLPTTYNENQSGGAFHPEMNSMTIGLGDERSITTHELQHAIQQREGWAKGGSPEEMATLKAKARNDWDYWSNIAAIRQEAEANGGDIDKAAKVVGELFDFTPELEHRMAALKAPSLSVLQQKAAEAQKSMFPYSEQEAYRRLAGEAEARATQARMNMDAAQRRATFPADSYDVPLSSLIIRGVTP